MNVEFPIVFVSDMATATAFYRDVLGLPLRFESPGWTEFGTERAVLALHPTDAPRRADAEGGTPAGHVRIGFSVPDLEAFHTKMGDHGVPCARPPEVVFGAKLAQYEGPDAVVFSVSEARSS